MRNLALACSLACLSLADAHGQTYLGVFGNVGNRMHYTGTAIGFDRPALPTVAVGVNIKRHLINTFLILYGVKAGIIGYSVKVHAMDTLRPSSSTVRPTVIFPDYSTFYGTLEATVGKDLKVGKRTLLVGVGGGFTYAHSRAFSSYGITTRFPDGTSVEEFYAETNPRNKITVLAKVATWFPISKYLVVGLEFNRHFSSIIDGHYEFYHTSQPSSGNIKLYQTELTLAFLVKVSRH